jgi:hypothetical protein
MVASRLPPSNQAALTAIAGEMHGSGVLTQVNSVVYCGIPPRRLFFTRRPLTLGLVLL